MPADAKSSVVTCGVCRRTITTVHIACAVCRDLDLCAECFARGAESADLPDHKCVCRGARALLLAACIADAAVCGAVSLDGPPVTASVRNPAP